jgi:uncharacterized protein (DUF2249 family)
VTRTETEAFEAMLAHHRALTDHVGIRVAALTGALAANSAHEVPAAELVAFLAEEVLPHAIAEEHTIYRAAATRAELNQTVTEMIGEHWALASAIEQLANTPEGRQAGQQAEAIAALFEAHVAKENDVLLPSLLADEGVDVVQLLDEMHRLTDAVHEETSPNDAPAAPDPEAALLSLLVQAATHLARAGQGDRACTLVASAWASLRVPRPDLAIKCTSALHGLVRLIGAQPVSLLTSGDEHDPDLDVRELAPAQRHQSIFAEYHDLAPGAGFILVNDHDPKPLRYQFEAEHPGEFTWDTLDAGPLVWRVRIGKTPSAGLRSADTSERTQEQDVELDVRALVHGRRHDAIFIAYHALRPGAGFILVNDHDPQPLRYQFEAQHPGEFTWDYVESGPEVWRVRIGRLGAVAVQPR